MAESARRAGEGSKILRKAETWFACVREKRAAPSAPPSWRLAATLIGGLRPGSLRVHGPCKEGGSGSGKGLRVVGETA
jgi:hypothetical protein